jgi:hypothetical protein
MTPDVNDRVFCPNFTAMFSSSIRARAISSRTRKIDLEPARRFETQSVACNDLASDISASDI